MSKIVFRSAPLISVTFSTTSPLPLGEFPEHKISIEEDPQWIKPAEGTHLFRVRGPFESARLLQAALEDFLEAAEAAHQGEVEIPCII